MVTADDVRRALSGHYPGRPACPEGAEAALAGLLNGTLDARNLPAWHDVPHMTEDDPTILVINAIINGHGVEAIWPEDDGITPLALYASTGDAYSPTVVQDYATGELSLTSYGDWLEAWEAEYAGPDDTGTE
jgi:hypothetical protein